MSNSALVVGSCPAAGYPGVCTLTMRVLNMVLALSLCECQQMAGSGDEAPSRGRKGLPRGLPSVAGVGSIRAYATEDWSLWQRR